MLNEEVDIEVYKRRLRVTFEGLTPLEVQALAADVTDRMKRIEKGSNIADTSKLAIMAALDLADELSRLKANLQNQRSIEDNKVAEMIVSLQNSVEPR